MYERALINQAKDYIEAKLAQTQKKFDVIISTTADPRKKESILKTVSEIERDMQKLQSGNFSGDEMAKYDISFEDLRNHIDNIRKPRMFSYKILRNIPVIKLSNFSNSQEINSIWTYLNYFGNEYLGLLSEQNLPLDYGHAYQRDKFFNQYNQNIRLLEEYGNVLEQIEAAAENKNKDYKDRLIKVQGKEYRDIIIKTGYFLYAIKDFIEDIDKSEKEGEKVLQEPEKIVGIKGVNSMLEGMAAKEALKDLYEFTKEFVDFLKIPDLRKIDEKESRSFPN